MFPDRNIRWSGLPSAIDGIGDPDLEIVRADCEHQLRFLVSQWSEGVCLRALSVEFDDPQAIFQVDEALYSAVTGDTDGGDYDGTVYLKETTRSALLDACHRVDPERRSMRHFLLIGLNVCIEVIDTEGPIVIDHLSYEAAMSWVTREEVADLTERVGGHG